MVPTKPQSKTSRSRLWIWAVIVIIPATFYSVFIHQKLTVLLGTNRVVQPIEDFQFTCSGLHHPLLEGCEDLWLDEQERKVYAACASLETRLQWLPGGDNWNASGRTGGDHIVVLDIDQPGADGLHGLHELKFSADFEGDLSLHGFDVKRFGDKLRFWLINHRPHVDQETGELLDPLVMGANSTIEVFDLAAESTTLSHIKTIVSDALITPNNLAVDAEGNGFVVSNDHSDKVPGLLRDLRPFVGTGSLSYCQTDTGKCHIATEKNCNFPNGVARGHDGRYYVVHSVTGALTVHEFVNGKLVQVDQIAMGVPADNVSVDREGNLIVATFPDPVKFMKVQADPYNNVAPAGVLSIWRKGPRESYIVKLVEDLDGRTLPSSTAAVRDTRSGTIFMSGVFSRFVGVCKPRS